MKQKIFVLLFAFSAISLSSCVKDSISDSPNPNALPGIVNQNTQTTSTQTTATSQYLGLQLAQNAINTDATIINFVSGANTAYDKNEDAIYFQGSGMVSLSSLSSDYVALSINALPLPKTSLTIGLVVNAQTDGIYKLNKTALKAIPKIFEIWLMDNYAKDSLDFRSNSTYAFNIYMSDATSYGNQRFSIVVRQNPALGIHLLNFTATKVSGGAQIDWLTENEVDYTGFSVQRSTDNGQNFTDITSLISSSLGTYNYLDKSPAKGTDQYRLKIQDLNGTITYSKVISLSY
ncbi:MAG: hypothetical protein JWQ63_3593 [Mucilaginibacter sp.]|jgi:hypothetical protein|nr:hypothetical protein [Mucilaginibacter sp.]